MAGSGQQGGRGLPATKNLGCVVAVAAQEGAAGAAVRVLCHELPLGSRCALHQGAPGRSWMERQEGEVPIVRGGGKVVVPKVRAGDSTQVVAEYLRWQRSVRLPSRFYMEHVRMINGGHNSQVLNERHGSLHYGAPSPMLPM